MGEAVRTTTTVHTEWVSSSPRPETRGTALGHDRWSQTATQCRTCSFRASPRRMEPRPGREGSGFLPPKTPESEYLRAATRGSRAASASNQDFLLGLAGADSGGARRLLGNRLRAAATFRYSFGHHSGLRMSPMVPFSATAEAFRQQPCCAHPRQPVYTGCSPVNPLPISGRLEPLLSTEAAVRNPSPSFGELLSRMCEAAVGIDG